ncbi:MAG: transposase [Candidatus Peribacteraceae bacterium]|nr:transposase [Candidatus Peribacteraceae bacterium]
MTQRHWIQNEEFMLVTTVTRKRVPYFRNAAVAREAVEQLYRTQERHPFILYGFVVMPDHCHILLRIPPGNGVSRIMHSYKTGLVFATGICPLWQRRFHVRCVQDAVAVLRYLHSDPVRREIATTPAAYPWSSASGRWDVTPIDWYS